MIKTQFINLNMIPAGVMPVLHVSQYDIGRPLGLVVNDGTRPVNLNQYMTTIEATRTDGTAITAAVTTDKQIGVFVTTATMTNKADHYVAQLVLFDLSSRRVASLPFVMHVVHAAMDENAESIEEDKSLYQQYTEIVQSALADIKSKLNSPGYYEGLTYETGSYKNEYGEATSYYIVTVPPTDPDGDAIPVIADCDPGTTPLIHAQKEFTTVTANSSLDYEDYTKVPAVIHNGEIIREATFDLSTIHPYAVYLGLDADRVPHEYPCTTPASQMVADGIKEASIAFFRLIRNGAMLDLSSLGLTPKLLRVNPRMAIFTKEDNTLCFFACDGRDGTNEGLTPSEMATIMLQHGAVQAWNLDGGGSTSLVVKGSKLNRNIDGSGTRDRAVIVTWNVPHKFKNTSIQEAFSNTGIEKQRIIQQLMPEIHTNGMLTVSGVSILGLHDGMYYVVNATDAPTKSDDGFVQVFERYATDIIVKKIYWHPYRQNTLWVNSYSYVDNSWTGWVEVDYKYGLLGLAQDIPSNSNLNDYIVPGTYRVLNATVAGTIGNMPEQRGGKLTVEYVTTMDAVKQTYSDVYGNEFYRYNLTNGFSRWVNMRLGKYLEAPINYGKTVRINGIIYSAGILLVSGSGTNAYGSAMFAGRETGLHLMNVDCGDKTTITLSNNNNSIDVANLYAGSTQWLTVMIFNNAGQAYDVTITEL